MQRLVCRAAANIGGRRNTAMLRRVHGQAHQLVNALSLAGADGHHRHMQLPLKHVQVNHIPVGAHLVHHVQGNHHGGAQLQKLQRQIQVTLQVGGVHNVDDHVRLFQGDEIAGHNFLHGIGAEGIDAGQVDNLHIGVVLVLHALFAPNGRHAVVRVPAMVMVKQHAGFLLHGHPGPVAHMLVGACQHVEQGGFAAVLVACQGEGIPRLAHACSPFPVRREIFAASSLRSVRA